MQQQQQQSDQAQQTGTRNETYDVIAVLYHALQGAENCQTYAQDTHDERTRDFFKEALSLQRQIADRGKQVLQEVLQRDSGGQSVFGWQSEGGPGATGPSQSTSTEGQSTETATF